MKKILLAFCFWCVCLQAVETDFDCIVVGTSPFSLFEAIYKRCLGNRVLIVEQTAECGGAWKSRTICGVPHVDLGCHEFGKDPRLFNFLEEYAGCKMIGTPPDQRKPDNDGELYPSQGCYELIHNLEQLMNHLGVVLLLNTKLESVFLDTAREIAEVKINGVRYTTPTLVLTNNSEIKIENPGIPDHVRHPHIYYHIGMLIEDPTPPRFTYKNFHVNGASRVTNYTTYSTELKGTGRQLITVQVHGEQNQANAPKFLEELKRQGLIDSQAQLLQVENYTYQQVPLNQSTLYKFPQAQKIFEIINTGHIANLAHHIDKWKQVMKPWNDVMTPYLVRAAG